MIPVSSSRLVCLGSRAVLIFGFPGPYRFPPTSWMWRRNIQRARSALILRLLLPLRLILKALITVSQVDTFVLLSLPILSV